MKRKFKLSLILIMVFLVSLTLVGCGFKDKDKSPEEIIQDAYGNKEFKISFSSQTLDKPLGDLSYSSKNIPTLPIPQKVGYIFEGWYFDPDFLRPYQDSTLLLTMKDVTLYPKWVKETFLHNGTYDIKFKASIVPGTVKKGLLTDERGGFRDITKLFNLGECYIEKNSEELLLKLQYDSIATTPYQSRGNVFTIVPSKEVDTNIYIKDKIDSLAEAVKTIFISINTWDLKTPLYFDVTWTNYEDPTLTEGNRYKTTTEYQIKFELEKIYGFSEAFADPDVPLEKGYYLAKSFFRREDNGETMGKEFNPVYSYLYSDGNEHYKLIKQNTPYTGLVDNTSGFYKKPTDYYYDLNMAFTSIMMTMDINSRGTKGLVYSDFYPETYEASKYHKTITEYHEDTGKFYNIIDLDKDLSKEYLCLTAVSGYMERGEGMGYVRQILSIDYQNLIKLIDVDYKPIEGECYEYEDEFAFYPGNYNDLDKKNIPYEMMLKYGISIEMPNFYYSAPSISAPLNKRILHSSVIEVNPDGATKNLDLSTSRGVCGVFQVNHKIYDYDPKGGNLLFLNRMNPQTFEDSPYKNPSMGSYNNQLHDVREVKNGKSVKEGSTLDLEALFEEKVNKEIPFSEVNYHIYSYENGQVNYEKKWQAENDQILMDKEYAVSFNYDFNGKKGKTLVEVVFEKEPEIEIKDEVKWTLKPNTTNHYICDNKELIVTGNKVTYPRLVYSFGSNKTYRMVNNYYNNDLSINPSKAAIFAMREGYNKLYLVTSHNDKMEIMEENTTLVYELNNEYNERKFIHFEYSAEPRQSYIIKDNFNHILFEDDIKYQKDPDTGVEYRVSPYNNYTQGFLKDETFTSDLFKEYYHEEAGYSSKYSLISYDVYSNKGNLLDQTILSDKELMAEKINEFLKDKDYGLIKLKYRHGADQLDVNFTYKLSYGGEANFYALNKEAYFTDTDYTVSKMKLTGSNRDALAQIKIRVTKLVDNRPSKNTYDQADGISYDEGGQYNIRFKVPGKYRITYTYDIPNFILGNPDSYNRYTEISFSEDVVVNSNKTDIKIVYHTDLRHPFKDGSLTKSVTQNLGEGITFLSANKNQFFLSEGRKNDNLISWSDYNTSNTYPETYHPNTYLKGEDYINRYHSLEIHLKADWKISFSVVVMFNDKDSQRIETTFYDGRYEVTMPQNNTTPLNKVFIGYTGGFLGSRVIKPGEKVYVPFDNLEDDPDDEKFTIYAIYEDKIAISIVIAPGDEAIGRVVGRGPIMIGKGESLPRIPRVIVNDKTYEHIGFRIKGHSELIDLNTYKFTKDTTLEVVFKKK